MQKSLLFKIAAIIALIVALLVPQSMIEYQIYQRSARQADVLRDVAASSAGAQQVTGPVLVVPWQECEVVKEWDYEKKKYVDSCRYQARELRFFPDDLAIEASADVEARRRGIYRAQLYGMRAKVKATYTLPAGLGIEVDRARVTLGRPVLALGISDVRGLRENPVLRGAGEDRRFQPGPVSKALGAGIHAPLDPLDIAQAHRFEVAFDLDLQGMESLRVVPLGGTTRMTLSSPWPHPSFGGRFLPRTHAIAEDGFKAEWKVSSLATAAREQLRPPVQKAEGSPGAPAIGHPAGSPHLPGVDAFAVTFIEPVNVYLLAERAVKYGLLFVVLTFGAFFVFELLKGLAIHPVQYGLVGLALAIFFQLLISLSEHLPFWQAYVLSTAACIGLIGFYLAHVLKRAVRGVAFGGLLSLLYGMVYVVLRSEDSALLMGSCVLFGALALAMVLTRNIDWYRVGAKPSAPSTASASAT